MKWWRWRGTSRWNQRLPNSLACALPKFGTVTASVPPGRSAPAARRRSATGSTVCSSECMNVTSSYAEGSSSSDPSVPARASTPRSRATSTASGEGSTPSARQPRAMSTAPSAPRPQPTSSARPGGSARTGDSAGVAQHARLLPAVDALAAASAATPSRAACGA